MNPVHPQSTTIAVRRVGVHDPNRLVALHMALGIARFGDQVRTDPAVADLMENSARRSLSIDLLVAGYAGNHLVAAWLAVEAPGRAALVLGPGPDDFNAQTATPEAAVAALRFMIAEAIVGRIALLEILLPPTDTILANMVGRAGFRHITRLIYLRNRCAVNRTLLPSVRPRAATNLTWVSYEPANHALFRRGLEATYVQSLDCPELGGLRSTDEVLAGHRAAGEFDPALWSLAFRGGEPVGVLMMNRLPSAQAAEIVYMGVAQPARGTGVADALLDRAQEQARAASVTTLALAVDARNGAARRLYARRQFIETGQRDAWIATPCGPRG